MQKNQSHATKTREKIQTSMLVNRLTNHALADIYGVGDEDLPKGILTVSQIKAIEVLLKKVLPDLKQAEVTGLDGKDLFPDVIKVIYE